MGPDEYGRLANYTRRQYPDVLEEQVREQPWFVKAMCNPIGMGTLGVIASKLRGGGKRPRAALGRVVTPRQPRRGPGLRTLLPGESSPLSR